MSSTTATLTSLRVAMTSPTYWDSISEVERAESVNVKRSRKFGTRIAWLPAGVLLQKWTDEIYPMVRAVINDAGNYEKILRKHNKEITRPCSLYMVEDPQELSKVRPTIVAACSKLRIAQRICGLLQDIECLKKLNLGFDYLAHREKITLISDPYDGTSTPSNMPGHLCGMKVLASSFPPSLDTDWKETTIGATLLLNEDYYCLSVAHAFSLDRAEEDHRGSEPSEASDISDISDIFERTSEHTSSVSIYACTQQVSNNSELGVYQDPLPQQRDESVQMNTKRDCKPATVKFGKIEVIASGHLKEEEEPTLKSLVLCMEMDWALIRIRDPFFFRANIYEDSHGVSAMLHQASTTPPSGNVVVVAGTSGVFDSNSHGITTGLTLPGTATLLDVWTVDSMFCMLLAVGPYPRRLLTVLLLVPGDCGSLVVDSVNGSIYGMIVATAPEAQESYMVPFRGIYEKIKSMVPKDVTVSFPENSFERRATSPSTTVDLGSLGLTEREAYTKALSVCGTISWYREYYRFIRSEQPESDDWTVAQRRRLPVAQCDLRDLVATGNDDLQEQLQKLDSRSIEHIRRLLEVKQAASNLEVSWDIIYIRIPSYGEMPSGGEWDDGVLSFDLLIGASYPPRQAHDDKPPSAANGSPKWRLPLKMTEERRTPIERYAAAMYDQATQWTRTVDDDHGRGRAFSVPHRPAWSREALT